MAIALISCTIKVEPIKDSTKASVDIYNNTFTCNDLKVHIPDDFNFRDSHVERKDVQNSLGASRDIRINEYYFYAKPTQDKLVSEGIMIFTQRFQNPQAYFHYGNNADPFRNSAALEKGAFKINDKKVWFRYHSFTQMSQVTMKILKKHGLKLNENNTMGLQYTVVRIGRYKYLAVMYIRGINGDPYDALPQFKKDISSTMHIS